jgi:hypothetical protein
MHPATTTAHLQDDPRCTQSCKVIPPSNLCKVPDFTLLSPRLHPTSLVKPTARICQVFDISASSNITFLITFAHPTSITSIVRVDGRLVAILLVHSYCNMYPSQTLPSLQQRECLPVKSRCTTLGVFVEILWVKPFLVSPSLFVRYVVVSISDLGGKTTVKCMDVDTPSAITKLCRHVRYVRYVSFILGETATATP